MKEYIPKGMTPGMQDEALKKYIPEELSPLEKDVKTG